MQKQNTADLNDDFHELGLHDIPAHEKGFTRKKSGKSFIYCDLQGKQLAEKLAKRLASLALPPSYKDVWYSPDPKSYILAIGEDTTGKKQYLYHPSWRKFRDQNKYAHLEKLAKHLPNLRRCVAKHIKDRSDEKAFLLATLTKLLDLTGMRIGNKQSASEHKTYGLTTLRRHHLKSAPNGLYLEYRGKGGVDIKRKISNKNLCELLEDHMESAGKELFTYTCSDTDEPHSISPNMLNRFIKSCVGEDFSAKDLRTWRFSCMFLEEALRQHDKRSKETVTLKSVLEKISEKTGNTPAILRSSYIHPGLIAIVSEDAWSALPRLRGRIPKGMGKYEYLFAKYLATDHASHSTDAINM